MNTVYAPAAFLLFASVLLVPSAVLGDEPASTPKAPPATAVANGTGGDPWIKVSEMTKLICGGVPDASYASRIRAVPLIGRSIPANDFFMLLSFLEKNPKDDPATPMEVAAIKNDVAAQLLVCEFHPDEFSARFLAMVYSPTVGGIWQNYTVQFLDALWKRENDPKMRQKIYDTLVACSQDSRITIAGTALLTLSRLPAEAVPPQTLGNLCMKTLANESVAWQDKITALQLAASAGDKRALDVARSLTAADEVPVMLKMSSFAVMGMLGDGTDKPVLERYTKSGELRLRTASRAALKKLAEKEPVSTATP